MPQLSDPVPVDLGAAAHHADPTADFAALRAAGPLVPVKMKFLGRMWMTTSFDLAAQVFKDTDAFARDPRNAGLPRGAEIPWWAPPTLRALTDNMLAFDGADHRRLRQAADHAFSRRDVATMATALDADATRLVAALPTGVADVAAGLAQPLPLGAICLLLGLDAADRARFTRWVAGISTANGFVSFFAAMPGLRAMRRHLERHFANPASAQDPGLMGDVARSDLSAREKVAMIFMLFFAGHETTVHLINGAVLHLATHPDDQAALRADPEALPGFVEEVLRHFSPVQFSKPRFARRDMTLGGVALARGAPVAAHIGLANRDAARFDDPETFDRSRQPNPHLSFGAGPHFCLGLTLARLEAASTLRALLAGTRAMSLAVDTDALDWRARPGMRALSRLPVQVKR